MRVRIPLYVKLMVSYLLVVGIVLVPTFVYLHSVQRRELRQNLEQALRSDLAILARRFESLSPEQLPREAERVVGLGARRMTVVAPDGTVLYDSHVRDRSLDNHAARPELQAALVAPGGLGLALRTSASTGEELLYLALRYPLQGPVRGFVRLAVSTASLDATSGNAWNFLQRAAALALSAAVLLSLVAAVVVSRPLRRIAEAARAFAAGDFGHGLDVRTGDELEEVSYALDELAAQLRDRLVAVGADRSTLQALLDDLPVGIVLYNADLEPTFVGARARTLCRLEVSSETAQARALAKDDAQQVLIQRVLADGITQEGELTLPWCAEEPLHARWVALHQHTGARQLALIVLELRAEHELARAVVHLRHLAGLLRTAGAELGSGALGVQLFEAAEQAETLLPNRELPAPEMLESLTLEALYERSVLELKPILAQRQHQLERNLSHGEQLLAEAEGRVLEAVRGLLRAALLRAKPGESISVRDELAGSFLKLSVEGPVVAEVLEQAVRGLRTLGGEADASVSAVWLPRV